ncbi:MAG: hypothetical protein ACE5FU_04715 [Nitrospinota bacterium]
MENVQKRILHTIKKNGFPEKRVSLPFTSILAACKKERCKFSDTLKGLEKDRVYYAIKDDKVLFTPVKPGAPGTENPEKGAGGPGSTFENAMDFVQGMDPKKLAEIEEKLKNMSPEERERLVKMAKELS